MASTASQIESRESTAPPTEVSADARSLPSFWERASFTVMRGLLRVHLAICGWHGLYVSAQIFGTLEYLVNHKRRRKVSEMLEAVFGRPLPPAERRRHVRAHFMRQRCDKVFYLVFDFLPAQRVLDGFTIVNRHLLDDGLARGRGVYSMLCHHGAHHVTGLVMSTLGYRVAGIRDPHEGAMRRYVQALWERKHPEAMRAKVLYSGDFVRDIYRVFKENWGLGSALDVTRVRDARLKTVPVQIFGETREFLTGTLQIAVRCKATVLQSFIVSEDDFRYRLELLGPMCDPETAEESPELLADVMQRYADNIAAHAREHPDHVTRA